MSEEEHSGEDLFRTTVRSAMATQGLGCLWAGAFIPAVALIVTLGMLLSGKSMSPSLIEFVTIAIPACILVGSGFAVAAVR